jgi:hypothetical protein
MKMLKFSTMLMGLALLGFSGCGSSDTTDGTADAGAGANLFGVTPGTYCYKVTSIAPGYSDGCGLGVEEMVGFSVPGTQDTSTGIFTLGNEGSLGGGEIRNNIGTLIRQGQSSDPAVPACVWNENNTTNLTMTDTNKFTASVTEVKSGITAACLETFVTCTSTWTWTFEITTQNAAAGCQ